MKQEISINYVFAVLFICTIHKGNTQPRSNLSVYLSPTTGSTQRAYLRPALVLIPPALCDLTPNICDLNCCGDKDCNAQQRESFSCKNLHPKSMDSLDRWDCNHKSDQSPFWFPLLCFVRNNSPYLGKFYPSTEQIIHTSESFRKFSKSDYKFTTPVQKYKLETTHVIGASLRFSLPRNLKYDVIILPKVIPQSTACIFKENVRYLKDHHCSCLDQISPEICKRGDFSLNKYLLNTDDDDSVWISSGTSKAIQVNTSSAFLCHKDTAAQFVQRFAPRHFTRDVWIRNVSNSAEECNSIMEHTRYDSNSGICHDVLISVQYQFAWNGTNVTSLDVTYQLAAVPVLTFNNTKVYVARKFEVTFDHVQVENNATFFQTLERSGNPGYEIGKPLIVGTLKWQNQSNENTTWEWEPGYMALLRTGSSGSCDSADVARFGVDTMASCYVTITDEDLANCSLLRTQLLDQLEALVYGEHIAKTGDFKFEDQRSVVPILRDETFNTSQCELVPTGLVLRVLYSRHVVAGHVVHRVVGATLGISIYRNLSILGVGRRLLMTSSVRFMRLDEASTLSRFWLRMAEPSDSAWREMLDPLWHVIVTGDATVALLIFWSTLLAGLVSIALLRGLAKR